MSDLGPDLDAARREVAERGLVPAAVMQLNPVVTALPPDALAPVKQQLKRFFSDAPWTAADDDDLADLFGEDAGGEGEHELAPGLVLTWRWVEGRFRLRVHRSDSVEPGDDPWTVEGDVPEATDLEATFDGPVVPEATPSPRTIRFATPAIHGGPSRSYESAADAAADPRVARLFRDFDAVTSVLVGPDFVAVSLDRPGSWEARLAGVLAAVTDAFAATTGATGPRSPDASAAPVTRSFGVGEHADDVARPRHLDRAWAELGALDAGRPRDLDRLMAASEDAEPARRQVAATLLADGPRDLATRAWSRLLTDRSRVVRRSVVDAIVDKDWPETRRLLEDALGDADAWVRWKALKGIARLGADASRHAIEARRDDPDFRVRLEAAAALRRRE